MPLAPDYDATLREFKLPVRTITPKQLSELLLDLMEDAERVSVSAQWSSGESNTSTSPADIIELVEPCRLNTLHVVFSYSNESYLIGYLLGSPPHYLHFKGQTAASKLGGASSWIQRNGRRRIIRPTLRTASVVASLIFSITMAIVAINFHRRLVYLSLPLMLITIVSLLINLHSILLPYRWSRLRVAEVPGMWAEPVARATILAALIAAALAVWGLAK
jgi:hypothetical protein